MVISNGPSPVECYGLIIQGTSRLLIFATIKHRSTQRSRSGLDLPGVWRRVIDTVLNLLFRCHHKRLTRPITPVSKAGVPDGDTYVVCLACGKQFAYDWNEMRIGKSVAVSPTVGVLDPKMSKLKNKKLHYAASAVPIAWIVGKALRRSRKPGKERG
jgi:hypothetical protein